MQEQSCVAGPVWAQVAWSWQSSSLRLHGSMDTHVEEAPTMEPSQPASHSQCVTEVEAVGPCELAGQASQAAEDDGAALYCAVVHADTLGPDPVYPASARQSCSASEAAGLSELDGHALHVSLVCAVCVLNLPALQSAHEADERTVALYLPAAHADTAPPDPV